MQDLLDTSQYVGAEMSALEREQKQIDERAAEVEWSLRQIMDKGTDWYPVSCDIIHQSM